jgi:hypothetical protein
MSHLDSEFFNITYIYFCLGSQFEFQFWTYPNFRARTNITYFNLSLGHGTPLDASPSIKSDFLAYRQSYCNTQFVVCSVKPNILSEQNFQAAFPRVLFGLVLWFVNALYSFTKIKKAFKKCQEIFQLLWIVIKKLQ